MSCSTSSSVSADWISPLNRSAGGPASGGPREATRRRGHRCWAAGDQRARRGSEQAAGRRRSGGAKRLNARQGVPGQQEGRHVRAARRPDLTCASRPSSSRSLGPECSRVSARLREHPAWTPRIWRPMTAPPNSRSDQGFRAIDSWARRARAEVEPCLTGSAAAADALPSTAARAWLWSRSAPAPHRG